MTHRVPPVGAQCSLSQAFHLNEVGKDFHLKGLRDEATRYYLEGIHVVSAKALSLGLSYANVKSITALPRLDANDDGFRDQDKAHTGQQEAYLFPRSSLQTITCSKVPLSFPLRTNGEECTETAMLTLYHNYIALILETCGNSRCIPKLELKSALTMLLFSMSIVNQNSKRLQQSSCTMLLVSSLYSCAGKAFALCERFGLSFEQDGISLEEDWFEIYMAAIDLGRNSLGDHAFVASLLRELGEIWLSIGVESCADEAFDEAATIYANWEATLICIAEMPQSKKCAEAA